MQLLLGILSVGFATFSQFLLTRAGQGDFLDTLVADPGCAKLASEIRDDPEAKADVKLAADFEDVVFFCSVALGVVLVSYIYVYIHMYPWASCW